MEDFFLSRNLFFLKKESVYLFYSLVKVLFFHFFFFIKKQKKEDIHPHYNYPYFLRLETRIFSSLQKGLTTFLWCPIHRCHHLFYLWANELSCMHELKADDKYKSHTKFFIKYQLLGRVFIILFDIHRTNLRSAARIFHATVLCPMGLGLETPILDLQLQ